MHSLLNDWIGKGRVYKDPPKAVSDEVIRLVSLPISDISSLLPGLPDAVIIQLVQYSLPSQSACAFPSTPSFSCSAPDMTLTDFLNCANCCIPTVTTIQNLRQEAGQAILDGNSSISVVYSTGGPQGTTPKHLPLSVLGLWDYLSRAIHAQAVWRDGVRWVITAPGLDDRILTRALALMHRVPWAEGISTLTDDLSVTHSADFLSNKMLCSNHVNAMLWRLNARVADHGGHLELNVMVSPDTSELMSTMTNGYPGEGHTEIERQGQVLSRHPYNLVLVTVAHSPPAHWAAMVLDARGDAIRIQWGDSVGRMHPTQHMDGLKCWLKYHVGDRLCTFDDRLKCAFQEDAFSCGIIAVNTLKHFLFGDPLWTQETRQLLRLREFCGILELAFPRETFPLVSVPAFPDSTRTLDIPRDVGNIESRGYWTVILKATQPMMLTPGAILSLTKITLPLQTLSSNLKGEEQTSSLILHPLEERWRG
ncbi:hypothetical protein NMY22_g18215 [Coprinellus aureogranulatus]|nr:hypothetical protein NMY22_g18215 [Coprinellus aureogranulatus]